jgi:hypothetical protein
MNNDEATIRTMMRLCFCMAAGGAWEEACLPSAGAVKPLAVPAGGGRR